MVLEERLVRDLSEKSEIEIDDYIVIEDLDGTKIGRAASLKRLIAENLIFDNAESMKMAKLKTGDSCITLGYYTAGDGGGAMYKIVYEPTALDDKSNWHYLYTSDTDRAKFVPYNGVIAPEQFGAYGDGSRNDYTAITKCLESKYKVAFSKGKVYSINKPIQLKSNMDIDLCGATIKPHNCSAFEILQSSTELEFSNINIRNGNIDMSDAISSTAFSFKKTAKDITIDNIHVYGGYGKVIESNMVEKLTVHNCHFSSISVKAIAIQIAKPASGTYDIGTVIVDGVHFKNYTRSLSIAEIHKHTNIYVSKCDMINDNTTSSTTFLYNGSSSETFVKNIIIDSVNTHNVGCLLDNQGNDCITIRNIKMVEANSLLRAINTVGTITIEGTIRIHGNNSTDTTPIFESCACPIYINTPNISYSGGRYYEKSANVGLFDGCSLYDITLAIIRPAVNAAISSNAINVPYFRNCSINIASVGTVSNITGGINNQIIALSSTFNATITTNGNIVLKNGTSVALNSISAVQLKYNSSTGKWVEIL